MHITYWLHAPYLQEEYRIASSLATLFVTLGEMPLILGIGEDEYLLASDL